MAGEREMPPLLEAGEHAFAFPAAVPAMAAMWMAEHDPALVQEERAARLAVEQALAGAQDDTERDPTAPTVPFALVAHPGDPLAHARLARALRAGGVLAYTRAAHVEGLAASRDLDLPEGAVVVFGDPAGPDGLGEELAFARRAVQTAARLGHRGTTSSDGVLPDLLLEGAPAVRADLLERVVVPLQQDAEGRLDLVAALTAWVDAGLRRTDAAAAAGLSVTALRNRLVRIEELTGLDLGDPRDLATAILALRASAHASAEAGERARPRRDRVTYPVELVRRMVAQLDLDAVAVRITDHYRDTLPSFGPLLPADGSAYAGIRDGLEEAVALICDERPPEEFDFGSRDARVLAELEQGVTPDDMVRSVGVGGAQLWRALCGVASDREARALSSVAGRIFRYSGAWPRRRGRRPRRGSAPLRRACSTRRSTLGPTAPGSTTTCARRA